MKTTIWKQLLKAIAISGAFVFLVVAKIFAQGPPPPSQMDNPLAVSLVIVAGALLLAIVMLGRVLINVAQLKVEREKAEKKSAAIKTLAFILAFSAISSLSFAQDAASTTAASASSINFGGLSEFSFYAIISVIALEIIVITGMLISLKSLIAKEKAATVATEKALAAKVSKESSWKKIWIKLNSFKSEHEETDTGHDYDGIHELDNRLPPWWLYGFYVCIVFAAIYLYRFHVSHSGPSSTEEYVASVAKANAEKEEYLKKAANKVDENTVTLLTDATALDAGKKIFAATCAPCHGPEGQGVVGPNLTDDYWLHGGSVKDVFKTIKYGVPEKGMKSWEADFSPVQLADLASYIKSLHGTKPANPKEPQGELYKDDNNAASTDSTGNGVKDSVKITAAIK